MRMKWTARIYYGLATLPSTKEDWKIVDGRFITAESLAIRWNHDDFYRATYGVIA